MNRLLIVLCALAVLPLSAQAQNPRVWLDTTHGPIILEIDEVNAPTSAENFLRYVDEGFYDGLVFHRVIDDFVIQSGGFDADLNFREPTYDSIDNEADNGLDNAPGTLAMARGSDPDSATSQFYINTGDNDNLDGAYAVFGEVVAGTDTVESIEGQATGPVGSPVGTLQDYPFRPALIRRAVRIDGDGFPLMPDHSGSWFDPDNAGVGFNLEITESADGGDPLAIVYWYSFADGAQFWLVGQANFAYGADEVTVELLSAESGSFQSAESEFETVGEITLRFDGCSGGTFSYQLDAYGSGDIDVARLSQPANYRCDDT